SSALRAWRAQAWARQAAGPARAKRQAAAPAWRPVRVPARASRVRWRIRPAQQRTPPRIRFWLPRGVLRFLGMPRAANLSTAKGAFTRLFSRENRCLRDKIQAFADGKFRQGNAADLPRRGDAALVSGLRHER